MRSWKARLLVLLAAVAMLATVSGPAMAESWDDDWLPCNDPIVWDGELYCPVDDWDDEDDEDDDWDDVDEVRFADAFGFDGDLVDVRVNV